MNFCYAIKDWQKHFENSESRKVKSLTWVPVKNKHDGKGYRRVAQHPKSVQVFCAWNLILQVASKMPTRGLLHDEDGPLQPSDLADMTGFPLGIFEVAFEVLQDPRIAWLVKDGTENPRTPPDAPGCAGLEQKGMEGNGTENKTSPPAGGATVNPDERKARFETPTLEAVKLQSAKIGLPESEAEKFWNYYQSNGWKVGRNPMKSWQHALTNWFKNWKDRTYDHRNNNQTHRGTRPDRNAGTYNANAGVEGLKAKVR